MAAFIKKQILKHLTKFTKNLSADKINLSTLRGEGELSNLELDCDALQNLMNLPTWLKIENACCNKVHVKIPWTKLKTTPISIFLDVVEVEMVACEHPRPPNGPSPIQASASSGETSYGFTVKVLEGISVNINSITIDFKSPVFNANLQISQLVLESTNPKWKPSDLKHTFIHDKNLDQVLTFKKMSLQTMRIVANAMSTSENISITPLRLITNHSEIMITFRRKASDCSIIASCLHLHFDDLLWVLTDSQVQSALLCLKAVKEMIERSNEQMEKLSLDKQDIPVQPSAPTPVKQSKDDAKEDQYASKLFMEHIILESSFHVDFDHVDLHICEESSPVHSGSQQNGVQGAAIQVSLCDLKVDCYLYHKPASDREHFRDFGEVMKERESWASTLINRFRDDFAKLREAARSCGNLKANKDKKPSRLSENCLSLRLKDVEIHQVTHGQSKNQPTGYLIRSTRKELHLPDEMLLLHFIHTKYYYPDGRDFPAPSDNSFMQINAPLIHAHWDTLIWLNHLTSVTVSAVQKALEELGVLQDSDSDHSLEESPHLDVRIQILMPKLFVPGPPSTCCTQPLGLEFQASRALVTNCREGIDCERQQLLNILDRIEQQHLAKNPDVFPSDPEADMPHLDELLRNHSLAANSAFNTSFNAESVFLTRNSLVPLAKDDVWSVHVDNVWVDYIMPSSKMKEEKEKMSGFLSKKSNTNNSSELGAHVPFIDSFPAQLWIAKSATYNASSKKLTDPTQPFKKSISQNEVKSKLMQTDLMESEHVNSEITDTSEPTDSPSTHSMRNKRLKDYYLSLSPDDSSSPQVQDTTSEPDQVNNQVNSTYIVLHTKQSLRLTVDHYQYIFLMSLPDLLEDVGKRLDGASEIQSSFDSPTSTDSHSHCSKPKKSQPVSTVSVRIDAPVADVFLVLSTRSEEEKIKGSISQSHSFTSDTTSLNSKDASLRPTRFHDLADMLRAQMPSTDKDSAIHDSPMSSESASTQGFENNTSVSGDSYCNDEPFSSNPTPIKLHHKKGLQSEKFSKSPSLQSISSEKSCLSDEIRYSSLLANQKESSNLSKIKSGSSGYESSSHESILNHETPTKNGIVHHLNHSRTSSDASEDQFVHIQLEESEAQGKDMSSATRSCGSGDASSISSQSTPLNDGMRSESDADSRVTNVYDCQNSSNQILPSENVQIITEQSQEEDNDMYSVVLLHISNGLEVSVDSNDRGSNIVKLNAVTVNAAELGLVEHRKKDCVLEKYSIKKVNKLIKEVVVDGHSSDTPNFSLRVDTGPLAGRFSCLAADNGNIQLQTNYVPLSLKASTLSSLGAFFEEDGPSKVTPMTIKAADLKLSIEIDSPPSDRNNKPVETITLLVHSAHVQRTDDGVFHINSSDSVDSSIGTKTPSKNVEASSITTDVNQETEDLAKKDKDMPDPGILTANSPCHNDSLIKENSEMKVTIEELRKRLEISENERNSFKEELFRLKESSNS